MSKKLETVEDAKNRRLKILEKRLKELIEFKQGKNEDGTINYEEREEWYRLPKIAQDAIKKEMHDLEVKIRQFKGDSNAVKNDFRSAIVNVLKYYGVEDKLPEIEENFNRHKEYNRLETLLEDLSNSTSKFIEWETKERNYYYY